MLPEPDHLELYFLVLFLQAYGSKNLGQQKKKMGWKLIFKTIHQGLLKIVKILTDMIWVKYQWVFLQFNNLKNCDLTDWNKFQPVKKWFNHNIKSFLSQYKQMDGAYSLQVEGTRNEEVALLIVVGQGQQSLAHI